MTRETTSLTRDISARQFSRNFLDSYSSIVHRKRDGARGMLSGSRSVRELYTQAKQIYGQLQIAGRSLPAFTKLFSTIKSVVAIISSQVNASTNKIIKVQVCDCGITYSEDIYSVAR